MVIYNWHQSLPLKSVFDIPKTASRDIWSSKFRNNMEMNIVVTSSLDNLEVKFR